ncbi:CaiB/BaiF CoA-transferase family protein [Conexibacter sp. SYSU D00693]|uniref:CaiB/BaiF CoA transferase family protein n=1 Tax=Conexibacter sp. SYSU D00693 TaxID=2812560 RepID=UPI00196A2796|nr:CaiB/BaiF CoA-transferase family protein [Conexibacter sp. SYSU D00693]
MGPLSGLKVLELGSIGPGPFAAMVLSDLGADVLRVERPGGTALLADAGADPVARGRPSVGVDLKTDDGRADVLRMAAAADALIEGNRPGVLERLGLGPEVLLARNPRLVVGRMTGYGQDGPLARVPGHDVNYLAISGALGAIAREGERPLFPLNLVGDYGGGGLLLALGIVCGAFEARRSGRGQVVDAAMVDGAALLTTAIHGLRASGTWRDTPGTNVLDSGAHFYEVYATNDGGHVAVGAIEPQFYGALLEVLGLDPAETPQWDRGRWPELKERFAQCFARRSTEEWRALLEHADACTTPVLGLADAPGHPHNAARGTFFERDGVVQPAPAPRFSRTPADPHRPVPSAEDVLRRWGVQRAPTPQAGSPS